MHLETLEARRLLTNIVAVHVDGNDIRLIDASRGRISHGDDFTVSYTADQLILTGQNGTSFKVGGQTLSTYTVALTAPPSITMRLNAKGNDVSITGDGTSTLSSLSVNLGAGRQDNSLSLTKVLASSVNVNGGRHNDSVVLSQSTVSGDLTANLGTSSGDKLDLESSTVTGDVNDRVGQLVVNHSTISGNLRDIENGNGQTMTSTDSTYSGSVQVQMGKNGVINMMASADGSNHANGSFTVDGNRRHPVTINEQGSNAVVFAQTPNLKNASVTVGTALTPPITVGAPTVNSQTTVNTTPTITGTYDSVNGPKLKVSINNVTYTLGTDAQLTSPSTGQWSLNLTGSPLPSGTNTVTVTSSDSSGDSASGTGTVTIPAPTVNSLSSVINTPTITGTYDVADAPKLTVNVNNTTYTLGTSSQLTSPSAGTWSLNLTGAPLPSGTSTVTVTNSDSAGHSTSGTGTVSTDGQTDSELSAIHTYETTNHLTATQTNSGLNYVITTHGTGAVPKSGQTISVNYTGFVLNSNGTLGTEFDSNVDAKFNHVSPFTFKLGAGSVIQGWEEAFALLPVNTVATLIIPSVLAYGSMSQTNIPSNSILLFNVTVVSVT